MSYGINYQTMFLREEGPQCLVEMEAPPVANRMFGEFIYQGDFAVMYGPEGAGKSILSLQIADAWSRGKAIDGFAMDCEPQKVVYLDFECKRPEFIRRYSKEGKNPHPFHPNFARVTFHPDFYDYTKMRKDLLLELSLKVWRDNTVVVVNNLEYLKCFMAESFVLSVLKQLQVRKKLTVLLVAGAKNSKPGQKAGVNQLSRAVRGIADSIFAVGLSQRGEGIRYLKHLKSSMGKPVYHEKQVAEFTINKKGNFTGFTHTGFGNEYPHVAIPPTGMDAEIIQLKLSSPSLTFAEIATQVGTYKMKVKRVLDKYAELLPSFEHGLSGLEDGADGKITLPSDPFRGEVGLTNHPSDSGVNQPVTLDTLVTPSFECGLSGLRDGADGKITPPSDPFRDEVGLTNHPSDPGVNQTETLDALVTPSFEHGLSGLEDGADGKITLPSDPFRGEVGLTNHPSDSGVNQPVTLDTLVTSSFEHGLNGLEDGADGKITLPTDPFRGEVGLTNHPSDPGVKQPVTLDTLVTPSFEHGLSRLADGADGKITPPSDPFRGEVGLTNHPSGSGVNQPVTLDTLVTPSFEHGLNGLEDGADGEITLPTDPFRNEVGLTNHPSGSGVNQPVTLDTLVTPSFEHGLNGLEDGADGEITLPIDPFRNEVGLTNNPSGSGVKQPETIDTLVTPSFEHGLNGLGDGTVGEITPPSDPFRGEVGLTNHPSDSGVNQPVTLDTLVTSSFEHGLSGLEDGADGEITLPSDPFRGEVGLTNHPSDSGVNQPEFLAALLTYSQRVNKRLAETRKRK